jgi:hypothetical protein
LTSSPRVIRHPDVKQVRRKVNGDTPHGGLLEPLFRSAMPTTEPNRTSPVTSCLGGSQDLCLRIDRREKLTLRKPK